MKIKTFARALVAALLAAVLTTGLGACSNGKTRKGDTENRPLSMSISTPDGVFNPFFSTSAYDGTIVSTTQISMLSTDPNGNIVCGDNEPVVVKDYEISDPVTEDGKKYTYYRFILKNGIKFSDGEPLTIKDVLFNLYVYLDPVYTGSSTIYSTRIVGLDQYRMQNDSNNLGDDALAGFEEQFSGEAGARKDKLLDYVRWNGIYTNKVDPNLSAEEEKTAAADLVYVQEKFREELERDWNTVSQDMESYKKDYGFTETWQAFLYNDALGSELLKHNPDGTLYKNPDNNDNYEADPEAIEGYQEDLDAYLAENVGKTAKDFALETAFIAYFPGTLQQIDANQFELVINYWATADELIEKFITDAKTAYFEKNGGKVKKISGITAGTTDKDFAGKSLGATHEMLTIKIFDVDPKAIYNFAFTVAPMHYYSSPELVAKFNADEGNFGVAYGDGDFMTDVINAPEKVGLPVGAGVYMASSENYTPATKSSEFYNNGMVYFERNPYFETTGANIHNANIKYLRYKVVETDQVIGSLANNDIDMGDPNATQDNIKALNEEHIAHEEIMTSGYGYVGINPRYVPNVNVRRAIIKAMNTQLILDGYYQGGLAQTIYRPVSKASWAYPEGAGVFGGNFSDPTEKLDYSYDSTGAQINELLDAAGYTSRNSEGVRYKVIEGYGTDTLDYKFTIAGQTSDHPAYAMFLNAKTILERCGFKIKVTTNSTALSDLASGTLAVWAAAWSSGIDPDMYQIYHKDSLASSVNNWGYKQIKLKKQNGPYKYEWNIIDKLSGLIDDGRKTTVQTERKAIYSQAYDLIMRLAVEFPTYQRSDMTAYNANVIDPASLTPKNELTPYNGLYAHLWEVNYL